MQPSDYAKLLIIIGILAAIFIVIRAFVLWYFKIDKAIVKMDEIKILLQQIRDKKEKENVSL